MTLETREIVSILAGVGMPLLVVVAGIAFQIWERLQQEAPEPWPWNDTFLIFIAAACWPLFVPYWLWQFFRSRKKETRMNEAP